MDLLDLALTVHEAGHLRVALEAVAHEISRRGGGGSASWIPADGSDPVRAGDWGWDDVGDLTGELQAVGAVAHRALPADASPIGRECEVLSVRVEEPAGTVALIAAPGTLEPQAWGRVAHALAAVAARDALAGAAAAAGDRVASLEARLHELRRSLEEGEVLHTLGLAANRSLDPDEVLELVTRLTRTALGASYVMLSTTGSGTTPAPAAVGLRGPAPEHDQLSDRVMAAGTTIRVGAGEKLRPGEFHAHSEEGMVVGLGVPLALYGQTIGALVIGYRREVDLTPRHVRLALTLAGHAAVAISNAGLHRALATRTAEAERAYEELRWSARAKEQFFASLSHELRTPLNAVLGYHSLVLDGVAGPVPPEARGFVESAHRAAGGLLHLVNDVLDLSKIEAGKLDLNIEPADLASLMEDAVAAVQPMADRKRLPVLLDTGARLPVIRTDVNRVRQIVVNLLSNAIKFTDEGQVSLAAALDSGGTGEDDAEAALRIQVRDTGPGIGNDEQERIFHEFEQIGGTRDAGGTGLGLPISRKLARLLGGELRVQSRPGQGATFTLTLPLDGPTHAGTTVANRGE